MPSAMSESSHRFVLAAKELWSQLEQSAAPVPPMRFLMSMREKFPQFAQQVSEPHVVCLHLIEFSASHTKH